MPSYHFNFRILLALMISIGILACEKDKNEDNQEKIQNHDDNVMMSILHSMGDKMDSLIITKDPDNDYALMMKVHHYGAVQMANLKLEKGKDELSNEIARSIIASQEKEIHFLDSFLLNNPATQNIPDFHSEASEAMERMQNNADLQIVNGNIDHDFAILMIQHHIGAIDLANLELIYGNSAGLKSKAANTIKQMQKEILDLQNQLLFN